MSDESGNPASKKSADDSTPPVIAILGVEGSLIDLLMDLFKGCQIVQHPYDIEKLMEPMEPLPHIFVCAQPKEGAAFSVAEVAQALRLNNQGASIFYATDNSAKYNRKELMKNGFSDTFFLPLDRDYAYRVISETLSRIRSAGKREMRSVRFVDIEPGQALSFDTSIYLPSNNKYIKMTNAGDPIEADRAEKLRKHKMTNIFVAKDEMQKFYDYAAERLKAIGNSAGLSETEKREKLQFAVRELIGGMITDTAGSHESGKHMMEDCQKIVGSYIGTSADAKWYDKILSITKNQGDSYSHATNVSTFAALFSVALGIGKPEELALAGLLHDIGLAHVPREVQEKSSNERSPEEEAEYRKHPDHGIRMIMDRKMNVSPAIQKIIMQHHERYDGKGYPKGVAGDRFSNESQLLAFADRFDELTSKTREHEAMSPLEAMKFIRDENSKDPNQMIFNPDLLQKIFKVMTKEEEKVIENKVA